MTDAQEGALRRYRDMAEIVHSLLPGLVPEVPMVRFWDRMLGRYDPASNAIWLPTPEHLAYYHGEPWEECIGDHEYLFLHELAHWGTDGEGHTTRMYAFLFWLGRGFGYKMMNLRRVELLYKPRAAKSGWRAYLRSYKEPDAVPGR